MVEPMKEEVCKDLLETLNEIKKALELLDADELRNLSDHTIHCSAIHQEKRAIYIAIITYSLSKIIAKETIRKYHEEEFNDFIKGVSENLNALIDFLEKRDFEKVEEMIKSILKAIAEFDKSFGKYAQHVLDFAKIKKGAKIYEHGLSLSSVAKMLGISKWELMEKVGETKLHEEIVTPLSVKKRFERLKKLLKE